MTVFGLLRALHVLSAIVWVGGMFFALLVLRPSLAALEPPQRLALHAQVFRRFFLIVWHAMPLMLATGFGMLFGFQGGFKSAHWSIHLMAAVGLAMGAVFLAIWFGPYRAFRAAEAAPAKAAAADAIRKLILLNLCLGMATAALALAR